jgi:hypothetical protein
MHQENIKILGRLTDSLTGGLIETKLHIYSKINVALKNSFLSHIMIKDIM